MSKPHPEPLTWNPYPQITKSTSGTSTKMTFQGPSYLSVPTVLVKELDDVSFSDLCVHDLP